MQAMHTAAAMGKIHAAATWTGAVKSRGLSIRGTMVFRIRGGLDILGGSAHT